MTDDPKESKISRNRLEALVDGIFAFAMTLLVTSLAMPHLAKTEGEATLVASLAEMQSEFISFLVAFFVLASFWGVHNRQYHYVRRIDSGLLRITLFILACVVLMPFTTNLSGDYSNVPIAVRLFHLNMFGLGLLFLAQWRYLTGNPGITAAAISSRDASTGMLRSLVVPVVSTLGFALSWISPSWSMAAYLLIMPGVAIVKRYHRRKT